MMGVLLTAPPPIMSVDKLPTFNIADADLQALPAKRAFPTPTASHADWEPGAYPKDTTPWDAVRDYWVDPLWKTGDDGQMGFVKTWTQALGWDQALAQVAGMPKRLYQKFGEVYVAAPEMTK
jgi:hypothetical protein